MGHLCWHLLLCVLAAVCVAAAKQAPPDHTRRDSWELAWEEEQQEQDAGTGTSTDANTLPPAALAVGTALSADTAAASRGPLAPPPRGTVPGGAAPAATAGHKIGPRLHASLAAAPAAPPAAAVRAAAGPARHAGALELASAQGAARPSTTAAGGAFVQQQGANTSALQAAPAGVPTLSTPAAPHDDADGNSGGPSTGNKGPPKQGALTHNQAGTYPPPLPPQQPGGAHNNSSRSSRNRLGPKAPEVAAATRAEAIERMLVAEAQQLPLLPVVLLLVMFAAVLLTSLFSKMLPCGSVGYWLVQWAVVPVLLGVWGFSRRRVLAKVALKKAAQMDFHGEVRWTPRKVNTPHFACPSSGVLMV